MIYLLVGGVLHILGKLLIRVTIFLKLHLNKRSTKEVLGLQSCKSPNFGNFGTPKLRVSGQNDIWVLVPWPSIESTIRGRVVDSLKSGPW
jgi:hypothetical protein